jgi:rod shape-determining protein MreD
VSAARALAFVLVGWVALIVTGVGTSLIGTQRWAPDVTLVIVLYVALGTRGRDAASSCALVALALGYLCDLLSAAPRGLFAATHVIVVLVVRAAAGRLMVVRVWQEIVVSFVVALAHGALVVALASPLYGGEAPAALRDIPRAALATAFVITPLMFRFLRALDRKLAPDPRGLRLPSR